MTAGTIKISDLPVALSVSDDDLIPIVQDGTTKRATVGQVQTSVLLDQTFLTATDQSASLPASRELVFSGGLTFVDGGPGSTFTINTLGLLNSLSSLGTNGLVVNNGGVSTSVTLVQPAAGITITNANGAAGNPTFALSNDLAALEGLISTGFAVRTAADTWVQRTITGTTSEVTVNNGDGVAGNPVISLPAALTFTGKTVTGGTFTGITVTTPTFSSPLTVPNGGTGAGTFTANGIVLGNGTSPFAVTAAMTNGQVLVGQTGAAPLPTTVSGDFTLAASGAATFATVNANVGSFGSTTQVATFTVNGKGLITAAANAAIAFPVTSVFAQTGAIPNLSGDVSTAGSSVTTLATVVVAGTNTKITYNAKGLVTAGTAAILASADFANQGTTTTVLHGNAAGNPSWGAVALAADVSGTLPATNGGTGFASYAVGDILYASTTTALAKLADVATGNALISGGIGVAPSWGKIALTTHVSGILPVANGGTGVATQTSPTTQVFTTGSGTYNTPAGCIRIEIELIGGGGGGQGSGTTPGSGGNGGISNWGTGPILSSGTALGATSAVAGAAGGTSSGGYLNRPGASGQRGAGFNLTYGGTGGIGVVGGDIGWGGVPGGSAGSAGGANSGNGGGGGGVNVTVSGGSGGGAGGYVRSIINSPAATYSYAVGAGGTAGTTGTGGAAGGAGGSGLIIVKEYYGP